MSSNSQVMYSQLGMDEVESSSSRRNTSGKQGHSCCGCCCDTRRAVIILNAIMIAVMALAILGVIVGVEFLEYVANNTDDDEVKKAGAQAEALPLGWIIVRSVILIGMFSAGIPGAVYYKPEMVQAAMAGYLFKLFFDLREGAIFDIIMDFFFVYPHVYFLKEMKENIMTPDNYPNEAQCCC